jgi:hypothetical protein
MTFIVRVNFLQHKITKNQLITSWFSFILHLVKRSDSHYHHNKHKASEQ